jgi:hypothetical protein
MDDQTEKAFDFAQESTKQILTLATGIIALTITFSKDFLSSVPDGAKRYALWSWGLFLISILFALWTLNALTGSLSKKEPSIYSRNITIPSILQIISFLGGLILTVIFGIKAASGQI